MIVVEICQVPIYYPYASPCADGHYRLVCYFTYYCTYNTYVKCVHCAKRFIPTPFFSFLCYPPFVSFPFPYYTSPIYTYYTYKNMYPFPFPHMYLYVLIYVLLWFTHYIYIARTANFYLTSPYFALPIYTKICTYYTYIYN